MNPFFDHLAGLLTDEARALGHPLEPATLGGDTSRALLDLTRAIAHGHERRFGPLGAYLVGILVGQLRAGGADLDDATAAALVDRVAARLGAPSQEEPPQP
ncbi:MAG: DUF6457 domain-containing protein [Candidatus Dormiibacterota bacterium]